MIRHKAIGLLTILSIVLSAGVLFSCSDNKEDASGDFDVQLSVPSTATVTPSTTSMTFKVLFGKAPLQSDFIVFEDSKKESYRCTITEVSEKSVTFTLFDGISAGTYSVSVQRGSATKYIADIEIIMEDGLAPAQGCTVYGRITCKGEPLQGVVVSDGIEVVSTDADGVYQMKSGKKYGYVFVSVPSGYETAAEGVLPKNHILLTQDAQKPERVDFTLFEAGDQTNHKMLVLGDMHLAGGRNNDLYHFAQFCNEISDYVQAHKSEKVYALTLGDMTWDYYWYDRKYQFAQYLSDVNRIKDLMIYHTIGNHDHDMNLPGDFQNAVQYMTEVAPDYYSFNIGQVHYVVLDNILSTSNGGGAADRKYNELVTDEQLAWLAKDLSFVPETKTVVVSMHATTANLDTEANRTALFNCVAGFEKVHFVTGHTHQVANRQSSNWYDHNCGAVCADWWDCIYKSDGKVHIATDGAPGGYEIFDIKGTDFSWRFKGTGMSDDIQFRSYDRNNIHLTAEKYMSGKSEDQIAIFETVAGNWKMANNMNEVYLNVWNYGPGWKIEVTENGSPLTVSQADGNLFRDPLHILIYMPTCGKVKEDSFTTKKCTHMWKVTAGSATSTLEIKVTDNFGNVYTETMTRPKAFDIATYSR
ncbi:MAG: calcineurin-like phosphoesterase C-terminal domain-containing protein [Candidatus Cryptobacteroides sp.]